MAFTSRWLLDWAVKVGPSVHPSPCSNTLCLLHTKYFYYIKKGRRVSEKVKVSQTLFQEEQHLFGVGRTSGHGGGKKNCVKNIFFKGQE